ncbi:hypothetical protein diail_9383 [Diaporthe ilicicola]|nr:hypothetical protein diail_9383 [Diaporthe ilicicola]
MHPSFDHFIVRPDEEDGTPGPIVPVIAIDQLPDWMQLVGVPRELDAEQTIGLINLGVIDKEEDSLYEVRLHHDKIRAILNGTDEKTGSSSSGSSSSPSREGKAKDTQKKKKDKKKTASRTETKNKAGKQPTSEESLSTSAGSSSSAGSSLVESPQPRAHPAERMLSASRHNVANTAGDSQPRSSSGGERPLRPHMTEAMRDEPRPAAHQHITTRQDKQPATVFCRHWCHHGTCKWGLECRYQHRMPTTLDGLREVGLKAFPTWYLLMMGGGGGVGGGGIPGLFDARTMLNMLGDGQPAAHCPAVQPTPSQALIRQHHDPSPPQQPSPMDLHLMHGRMSTLLASSNTMSNRQKLKQLREMRHLFLRGAAPPPAQQQQQPRVHNYANLYTNASVAANAATIQRQAERQRQARDNQPVATARVRAREAVEDLLEGASDGGVLPGSGARRGRRDSGDASVRDGSHGVVAGRGGGVVVEEKLIDIE